MTLGHQASSEVAPSNQHTSASSVNQIVRLPRLRSVVSQSRQFVTRSR